MGVRGLFSYVKKRIPTILPHEVDAIRIGIDAHGLLYLWQDDIDSLKNMIQYFKEANHNCIFVFDGEAPQEKKEKLVQRRQKREETRQKIQGIQAFLASAESAHLDSKSREYLRQYLDSLNTMAWQITYEYRNKVIEMIQSHGMEVILAKGEADDVLVNMMKQQEIDCIMSFDMDYVKYGINRMWIPNFKQNIFEVYDFDIPIFCDDEDINIETLADVARLCGEHESKFIYPSQAFGLMRYYGSLQNLAKRRPEYSSFLQPEPL
jgi:5'-3' exonuclease